MKVSNDEIHQKIIIAPMSILAISSHSLT